MGATRHTVKVSSLLLQANCQGNGSYDKLKNGNDKRKLVHHSLLLLWINPTRVRVCRGPLRACIHRKNLGVPNGSRVSRYLNRSSRSTAPPFNRYLSAILAASLSWETHAGSDDRIGPKFAMPS